MPSDKTNILIIMADELRNDIVLHQKYPYVKTPNLDRLRNEGVTCLNAFCQTPTCVPSRASFITGKYPHQIGMYSHSCVIPDQEKTLGHYSSELGYDAVSFGKTHHANPGFRSYTYDIDKTMGCRNHGYNNDSDHITGVFEKDKREYCDFVAADQFREYLETENNGKLFSAFVGIYAPYPPLYPPAEYAEMYSAEGIELPINEEDTKNKPERQEITRGRWVQHSTDVQKKIISTYLGMVTLVDDCVGEILEALEKKGVLDDTVIVFTSDHGEQLGEHSMIGKWYNFYEGCLRVPLIFRLPGQKHAGTEVSSLCELTDVCPTLCESAGILLPEEPYTPAGRSLLPVFEDSEAESREYVFSVFEFADMIRTQTHKLVIDREQQCELYDLKKDPGENENLYGNPEYADMENQLKELLIRHLLKTPAGKFSAGKNTYFG